MARVGYFIAVAVAVATALLSWHWPVTLNLWRLTTAGWVTAADRPLLLPDATRIYRPLEVVAGLSSPGRLPRARDTADDRFAAAGRLAAAMDSYALLIWHNGRIVYERYWQGADPGSRPESASMHKTVVALAVGAAVAEGHIAGLDTPLGNFIGEWRGDPRGRITVGQVLGMASGLDTTSSAGGVVSETSRFLAGFGAASLVLSRDLIAPPGTVFGYRNINTQLLGIVLERATNSRYAEYLSRVLWQPLGAADAYVWLDRPGGLARTYTTLLARPEDWLRVGLLIKDRGRIGNRQVLQGAWIDEMLVPSPLYANYGLQIWLAAPYQQRRYYNPATRGLYFEAAEPFAAPDTVFLDGVGGQRVYVSRAQDLVVVRLGAARPDWDDAALPNAVVRALAQ